MGARLYYHGTSEANAKKILRTGFRAGTYFTDDLANALYMGGPVVFWVLFFEEVKSESGWQFTIRRKIPPSRIGKVTRHTTEEIFRNTKMMWRFLGLKIREEHGLLARLCPVCHGDGELDHEKLHAGGECVPCETCNTQGFILRS